MKPSLMICYFLLFLILKSPGQDSSSDYKTIVIDKQIKEFPDKVDLSDPLKAGITCYYVFYINDTKKLWRDVSSQQIHTFLPDPDTVKTNVNQPKNEDFLNDSIREVLIYKDSIAWVIISHDNYFLYRSLVYENGKWLNDGEDNHKDIQSVRNLFKSAAPILLAARHKNELLGKVSTDTLNFLKYVKEYGKEPKTFIMESLAKHKLVIYGEVHRRQLSWDLLKEVIRDPQFADIAGTVFLELPSYQQNEFNRFYANEKSDTGIVLEILRSQQIEGWWDKGEYEFLIELWNVNKKLPYQKKIRVIGVDEQPCYETMHSPDELEKYMENSEDRNEHMAKTIEQTIRSSNDNRNNLFVVGYMHAYKTNVPTNYPESTGQTPKFSAGAELSKRFSDKDVFTIFQHSPRMNNNGHLFGEIRKGLFDYVFAQSGNKPIAFNLFNSPFGAELFDADDRLSQDYRTGSFENNFDGYVFLGPLKEEPADYLLYEICSDEFVKELERRFALMNSSVKEWYGISESNKESIIQWYKKRIPEGNKRWGDLYH